jgi:hypothetical protein
VRWAFFMPKPDWNSHMLITEAPKRLRDVWYFCNFLDVHGVGRAEARRNASDVKAISPQSA